MEGEEVNEMALFQWDCKDTCAAWAVVAGAVLGIVAAFLRLTAVITLTPVVLIVAFGIAVAYLAVALVAAALSRSDGVMGDSTTLSVLLTGLVGTILLSVVLLAIPFAAASVVGALLTGALVAFFTQAVIATACWVKALVR